MSLCVTSPPMFSSTRLHSLLNFCRKPVSRASLVKAWETIWKCERDLMSQCPRRLEATFLIAKADYFIRKTTMKGSDIVEQQRRQDFISGDSLLCCILCHSFLSSSSSFFFAEKHIAEFMSP